MFFFSLSHSESLFSTECIDEAECTYASTFWFVIGLYGIGYVCFFVFELEWKLIVRSFARWILVALNIKKRREIEEEEENAEKGK